MEVLYHISGHILGISSHTGLKQRPYIWSHVVGTSNLGSWNGHWNMWFHRLHHDFRGAWSAQPSPRHASGLPPTASTFPTGGTTCPAATWFLRFRMVNDAFIPIWQGMWWDYMGYQGCIERQHRIMNGGWNKRAAWVSWFSRFKPNPASLLTQATTRRVDKQVQYQVHLGMLQPFNCRSSP